MALRRGVRLINPLLFSRISAVSSARVANISTSKKSKDTLISLDDLFPKKQPPPPKTVEDFADTKNPKSWISYGYDETDYEEDRFMNRNMNFLLMTVVVCGCAFIMAYAPDMCENDWTNREAFILMHKREALGQPLVDKNYADPANIELPSDEELGDTEIIL